MGCGSSKDAVVAQNGPRAAKVPADAPLAGEAPLATDDDDVGPAIAPKASGVGTQPVNKEPGSLDAESADEYAHVVPPKKRQLASHAKEWDELPADDYQGAPFPGLDEERVKKLHGLGILDTDPEERFDNITKTLSKIFDIPICLVSLVDEDRQWFKSKVGLDACSTDRKSSFCAWTLLPTAPEVLVVRDTKNDPRFRNNPLVLGPPNIRFYAGAPLMLVDGTRMGSLCLIDSKPRDFPESAQRVLVNMAEIVSRELERGPLEQAHDDIGPEGEMMAAGELPDLDDDDPALRMLRAMDALGEALVLVEAHPEGAWPIVYGNAEWAQLSGYEAGKDLWELFTPRRLPEGKQPAEAYAGAVKAGVPFASKGALTKAGGDVVSVSCRLKPAAEALDVTAQNVLSDGLGEEELEVPLYFVTLIPLDDGLEALDDAALTTRTSPIMSVADAGVINSAGSVGGGHLTASNDSSGIKAAKAPFVDVRLGPMIGQGGYGRVYKGLWDGAPVAVKIMEHSAPANMDSNDMRMLFEATLSVNVAHPQLVQSFKFSSRPKQEAGSDDDKRAWETWIVQEYCDMGNLQQSCDEQKFVRPSGEPDYPAILSVCREVAGAMCHLHGRNLIHGDLSANNVMLTSRERAKKGYSAKVGDFGLARTAEGGEECSKPGAIGTVTHMPPETLTSSVMTFRTDVYSFGVLMWQMITCKRPWEGMMAPQIVLAVTQQERDLEWPDNIMPSYRELGLMCVNRDPDARPDFKGVLDRITALEKDFRRTKSQAA
ncbi:unnamed protein product [Pedinophyceae sp. YPF-701]|nr:unnamed protein product [Pedinophyceae sp. YPF-701]